MIVPSPFKVPRLLSLFWMHRLVVTLFSISLMHPTVAQQICFSTASTASSIIVVTTPARTQLLGLHLVLYCKEGLLLLSLQGTASPTSVVISAMTGWLLLNFPPGQLSLLVFIMFHVFSCCSWFTGIIAIPPSHLVPPVWCAALGLASIVLLLLLLDPILFVCLVGQSHVPLHYPNICSLLSLIML